MHPLLLARALAGDDELVEVRYATGIPSPDVDPERYETERRRHDVMVATDVVVLEKPLRYRWEWSIRDRDLGKPHKNQGEVTQARVKSRNRGQEKGIDVWLALDALVMCTREDLDCVIVATADTDLDMVRDYVRMVPGNETTKVVQARILNDRQDLRQSPAWDATLAIDRAMFDQCRDDMDYGQPLNAAGLGRFLHAIDSQNDGMRDQPHTSG